MKRLVMLLVAAFMATCFAAQSAIIVADATWDASEGWSAADFATLGAPEADTFNDPGTILGEPALQIGETAGGSPGDDLIFTESGEMAGNKNYIDGTGMAGGLPVTMVYFDFYTDQASTEVSLYFRSDTQNAYWFYDLGISGSGWHIDEMVQFSLGAGWSTPDIAGYDADDFNTALGDVDELGFLLTYQPNVSQLYGVDNFELHGGRIPEPGTYSMLGFAFLSLGVTFRKRLGDYWAQVKQQIFG